MAHNPFRQVIDEVEILRFIERREERFLATPGNRINPFVRSGVTAQDIAFQLGWHKGTNRAGGLIADSSRAKKLLAGMVREGALVHLGDQRTLEAGSRPKMCYCTPGFPQKYQEFMGKLGE